MDKEHEGVDSSASPWQVIAMGDYAVPTGGSASALKKRWQSLGALFRGDDSVTDFASKDAELQVLPSVRLAHLVPPIDWEPASTALAAELDAGDSHHRVRFLVGQPFCDHPAILLDWADRQRAQVLAPPDAAQILAGDTRWLETLTTDPDRPWVLPALERCFLRHRNGLDLLRWFLERALSGALGPGVIGCDSWAFAFVQRIWPLPGTPVLTLQAFDGPALADYFVRTPRLSGNGRRIRVLSARSGKPLVPDDEPDASGDRAEAREEREQALPELRQLAAHCRGNPGLAWHYWCKQLRTELEREPQEQTEGQEADKQSDRGQGGQSDDIIWVAPDLEGPSVPTEMGEDVAFILHALLLHRGLPADLLAHLLSMPRARVLSQLLRLEAIDLLQREDECWQIAPQAYPAVREFLRARAYLIDAF